MSAIRTYSRDGNFIRYGEQLIEIKTRKNGTRFLFQEKPTRTYLSGLRHRPDIGESFHQIDIIRDGTRRLYLMEITDNAATLHSIPEPTWQTSRPTGNPRYNNGISGQSLSARDSSSGGR